MTKQPGMAEGSWPEFTDNDIRHINAWLREGVDPRRSKLLPQILREWAEVDRRQHFGRESPAAGRKRRERLAQLGNMAERLLRALDLLDPRDASTSAGQVGMARGQEPFQAIWNEENKRWLANSRDCIETIATAAKRPLKKPTRGQPCNIPAYLMMMDIAAIFEYLTDTRATRTVDWKTREETGPFRDFAGAIWSVVFSGADGLSAALKNWAEAKKKYAEPSLLMANIAMRHPEWGLFGPF